MRCASPARAAYGEHGVAGKIPAETALNFIVIPRRSVKHRRRYAGTGARLRLHESSAFGLCRPLHHPIIARGDRHHALLQKSAQFTGCEADAGWRCATSAHSGSCSLTLRTVPVGLAYAIWSRLGIVLISLMRLAGVRSGARPAGDDQDRADHRRRGGDQSVLEVDAALGSGGAA